MIDTPTRLAPGPRERHGSAAALSVLLLLFSAWSLRFIWTTSFIAQGQRVFCLADDAMITMTYARNLVEGHGLNWARWGEPVEGFTHPLWLLAMLPWQVTGAPLVWRSLGVQLLSLALLAGHLLTLRRLMLRHFAPLAGHSGLAAWLPAVALTAAYYPLNFWALMGMETGAQALLLTAAVLATFELPGTGAGGAWRLGLCLALGYLLRMDMLLAAGLLLLHAVAAAPPGPQRRKTVLQLVPAAALLLAAVAGYEVFRLLYFHSPLPNTYYLKLTGTPIATRLHRGLLSLGHFAAAHWALLLIAAAALAAGLRPQARPQPAPSRIPPSGRRAKLLLLATLPCAYAAYDVWVGGDVWDLEPQVRAGRFLAFAVPLLFVLLNAALNAHRPLRSRRSPHRDRLPAAATAARLTIAATVIAAAGANGLLGPDSPLPALADLATAAPPFEVISNEIVYWQLTWLRPLLAPAARVATVWAGIPGFFSDYRLIDQLGFNDRVIARQPDAIDFSGPNWRLWCPGHSKWDTRRVFELRPDAFFQTWAIPTSRLPRRMRRNGYTEVRHFWLRADLPPAPPGAAGASGLQR